MIPTPVSSEVFRELARTRPTRSGAATLRAGLHARRLLLLKSLLVRVGQWRAWLAPEVRQCFEADWALLERAEQTDATVVREVVDYPMTGAWLAEALSATKGAVFERHLAHFGGVAVAAAIRAGCRLDHTLNVRDGALFLPSLGVLRCLPGRVRLHGWAGVVRITDGSGRGDAVILGRVARTGRAGRRARGGPAWSALRTLPGDTVLDDLDPYRVPPQGIGPSALPAAERPHGAARTWSRRWHEADALLAATDPGRAAETRTMLSTVVPLAPPECDGTPMSATLRAAPGAVLTQLPADAWELTEVLVHETHHTKLAALETFVPLCHRGDGALHRVGWRPDPRPVAGVLQGAYAHLALTDLWWRARADPAAPAAWRRRAGERFENYRDHVEEALSILNESDELTLTGREFAREMSSHHASLGVVAPSTR